MEAPKSAGEAAVRVSQALPRDEMVADSVSFAGIARHQAIPL
jgi:hypothetical protein